MLTTRRLFFGWLFLAFTILLGGVGLACYLQIEHQLELHTYDQLAGQLEWAWRGEASGSPPPPLHGPPLHEPPLHGPPLHGPPRHRQLPNLVSADLQSVPWQRLGSGRVSARLYDASQGLVGESCGMDDPPLALPDKVGQLFGQGQSELRYLSHNRDERWLMWALPIHDPSGRLLGALELGMGCRPYEDMLRVLGVSIVVISLFGLAISAVMAILLSNYFGRPITAMASVMRRCRDGDFLAQAPLQGTTEMQVMARDLNRMVADLGQIFENQRAFVANASHELKTPLTSLTTMTELLHHRGQELSSERRQKAWTVVEREIARMSQLVQDLLTLSKMEQSPAATALQFDAVAALRDLVEDYQVLHPRCEARLPEGAAFLMGEPSGWVRVVRNLLDNALAYTPEPGRVSMRLELQGQQLVLEVADQGKGIPAEDLEKVTGRFYRSDPSRSRQLGGTGLGLAIVDGWVKSRQGQLTIESRVGEGTTVVVRVPQAPRV